MRTILDGIKMMTWDLGFFDPATSFAEALIDLYNILGFFLVLVFVLVIYLFIVILFKCLFRGNIPNYLSFNGILMNLLNNTLNFKKIAGMYVDDNKKQFLSVYDITEYHALEKAGSFFPASILATAIVPSFSIEYGLDPKVSPYMVVKVIGNQGYWSYECVTNLTELGIDLEGKHYMHSDVLHCGIRCAKEKPMDGMYFIEELKKVNLEKIITYSFEMHLTEDYDPNTPQRLLNVDNRLVVPVGVPVRLLITSADVLHSFSVPGLGVKVDAIPGRLSSFMIFIDRPGLFFGQCSEICGPMHGFMPIVIEAIPMDEFVDYILSTYEPGALDYVDQYFDAIEKRRTQ